MSEGFTYKISPFIIEVCGKEPKEYVHQVDVKYTAYVNTNTSIIKVLKDMQILIALQLAVAEEESDAKDEHNNT